MFSTLNHIHVNELKNTFEKLKKNERSSIKKVNLSFDWLTKGKKQFNATLFYEEGSQNLFVDNPKVTGGNGKAPTPLDICNFSFAAMFTSTFATFCSLKGIPLKKLKIRSTLEIEFAKVTGVDMSKPPINSFSIILSVFSDHNSKEELQEIFELTKKRSPIMFMAQNSIPVTTKASIQMKPSKKESNSKKINNIDIEEILKTREYFKKNPSDSIIPCIIEGEWIFDKNEGPQFSAQIGYGNGKNLKLFTDSRVFLGGESTSPFPIQYFLAGISCCLLTHYAYASSLRGIQLDHLSIESQIDENITAEFGLNKKSIIPEISFHFEVGTDQGIDVVKEITEDCILRCPITYLLLNNFNVDTELLVNQSFAHTFEFGNSEKKCFLM
ncbi:hydroperoxide reductase [Anaeramoeba ignava]|uniref:Hydroperoxide reductase n=1 Tax=Anaeramoeba ignava TaxID=1746090 RepID=A0A9Q0RBU4_ANAIG|nr:hydroperoxide reductase [Anaeramoeba ignava]